MGKQKKRENQPPEDLLSTLGDFTSKENWDKFFTLRGGDNSFEWYAEWPELRDSLIPLLQLSGEASSSSSFASDASASSSLRVLVPGCGNSRLSEHLYDAGFPDITNVDFSKVVISDMLRRNIRDRPRMRWRVMDITAMQFADGSFDAVLDKGGLDALMEPEHGTRLGSQYLSEVKRVLISGGKFICLTLAESHVLGLLFSKIRFGWKTSVHYVPHRESSKAGLCTFMVVSEKDASGALHQITKLFDNSSLSCIGDQALGLLHDLENENQVRTEYSNGSDLLYSLEDLQLGVKGDLLKLRPGQRLKLTLGGEGSSCFSYKAVLLDAKEQSDPFSYQFAVFIVSKSRTREWLYSSEEGQWLIVESSRAGRLLMVMLDSSHSGVSMDEIQKDLSPLVKKMTPEVAVGAQIPFMMASDGIKERNIVHQVTSSSTGPIVVEDVIYECADASQLVQSNDLTFRRLVFQRTESLVQSEALLVKNESLQGSSSGTENKRSSSSSKSKKKGSKKHSNETFNGLKVCHEYLASSYHMGIISGFMLVAPCLQTVASCGKLVNVVVVGLGAGLLPMFLHQCMQFLHIEVVELDREIVAIARDHFAFKENEHLKVHVTDGIEFVREIKGLPAADASSTTGNEVSSSSTKPSLNGTHNVRENRQIDVLIIDVDSSDSSSEMTCPAADFVDLPFLQIVHDILSEGGLFIVNLVTRSSAVKDKVISRMKVVFNHLYGLQLEEDVNMVLFALRSEVGIKKENFPEASSQLEKLLSLKLTVISQSIADTAKKIECLK